MIFKEIPLIPTHYCLDFWLFDSLEQACEQFSKRYGESKDFYKDWIIPNMVSVITSTVESEAKGDEKIVMNISAPIDYVIVHEVVHVVFKLSKHTHVEMKSKSQEWVAYMAEYIFIEIKKALSEQSGQ